MSGPEGSSNKHCIVCAVGIFCPEHSTICIFSVDEESTLFCLYKSTEDWLMRAILSCVLYVKIAGAWCTGADGRQKAILPAGGRIDLSANERIAEFLDFAIQAKFAYVNKLRQAQSAFLTYRKLHKIARVSKTLMCGGLRRK